MIKPPKLEVWNYQVLMLVQALIGSISENFRMVAILWVEREWVIQFYLESKSEEDIDEIEEIVCQYTAYQDSELKCRYEVIVGSKTLPNISPAGRAVYRRRE